VKTVIVEEEEFRRILREEVAALRPDRGSAAQPEFLLLREAADLMRVNVAFIRELLKAGRLRAYGPRRAQRIRRDELITAFAKLADPTTEKQSTVEDRAALFLARQ